MSPTRKVLMATFACALLIVAVLWMSSPGPTEIGGHHGHDRDTATTPGLRKHGQPGARSTRGDDDPADAGSDPAITRITALTTTSNDNDDDEERAARHDDAALLQSNKPGRRLSSKSAVAASDVALAPSCTAAANCLQCLFRVSSSGGSDECVWLGALGQCVAASDAPPLADAETIACPAILHRTVPAKIGVVHVAIRKGGPEALVQLHLALAYWGFDTALDTRRSKKQKGGPVVPFFREMYAAEFARTTAGQFRYYNDYDHWQHSGKDGEVLLATETWPCRNDRTAGPGVVNGDGAAAPAPAPAPAAAVVDAADAALLTEPIELRRAGVRYAQWHLTVWPRKPRSGCTIMAHTRYIASTYMVTPLRALLFPYVSPHIVRLALGIPADELLRRKTATASSSAPLLMYDGDVKLDASAFRLESRPAMVVKKAQGFTPAGLYDEYARASVCVDWELPGGERFIYESALFGCCPVVDRSLNGLDTEDFPLPDVLRAAPTSSAAQLLAAVGDGGLGGGARHSDGGGGGGDAPSLHAAIEQCLSHRAETAKLLRPLRLSVLRQRVRFHRHVRRYFSNNAHIVTAVASAADFEAHVVHFIVATLVHVPFATIEVVLSPAAAKGARAMQSQLRQLLDHSYLAAVLWTVWRDAESSAAAGVASAGSRAMLGRVLHNAASVVTTSATRVAHVAFVPVDAVVAHSSVVHYLGSLASIADAADRAEPRRRSGKTVLVGEHFVFADVASLPRLGHESCDSLARVAEASASHRNKGSVAGAWAAARGCDSATPATAATARGAADVAVAVETVEATLVSTARRRIVAVAAADAAETGTPALPLVAANAEALQRPALDFLCLHALYRRFFPKRCDATGKV